MRKNGPNLRLKMKSKKGPAKHEVRVKIVKKNVLSMNKMTWARENHNPVLLFCKKWQKKFHLQNRRQNIFVI